MKQIDISTKKHPNTYALVDDEDFEDLNQWKWHASEHRLGNCYASRTITPPNGKQMLIKMHREILKPPKGACIDHADGNRLNNTRANLRICTNQQNQFNRGAQNNNTSGFRGVSWHKSKRWQSQIKLNGKKIFLGCFLTPEAASQAYEAAALKLHGEFYRDTAPGEGGGGPWLT